MSEKFRTFIAIDFPDEIVKEIARVQEILGKQKFTGKLTELENLHLTLKFLGELDEKMLSEVKKKLEKLEFNEFDAYLDECGSFSYKSMPKIIWIKVGGKGIFELQKKIDDSLEELFKKEERFMGHLTIARIKYVRDKEALRTYIKKMGVKNIKFRVKGFKLMSSELRPLGPVYSVTGEYFAS